MKYGETKQLNLSFSNAVEKTKLALAKEGFGILTEIDVKTTLKKKLNVDFDNYIILGACNPQLAYKALKKEKEIGLLLPCNIILYQNNRSVYISVVLPEALMSVVQDARIEEIAKQVQDKLIKVINNV